VICFGSALYKPWGIYTPLQMHGFPGNPEAGLHLRAYRHIFNILAQGIAKKMIQLMATVIAHVFTKQTGADAQSYTLFHEKFLPGLIYKPICRKYRSVDA
jgi:hypothetical protein